MGGKECGDGMGMKTRRDWGWVRDNLSSVPSCLLPTELLDEVMAGACSRYSRLELPEVAMLFLELHGSQRGLAEQQQQAGRDRDGERGGSGLGRVARGGGTMGSWVRDGDWQPLWSPPPWHRLLPPQRSWCSCMVALSCPGRRHQRSVSGSGLHGTAPGSLPWRCGLAVR